MRFWDGDDGMTHLKGEFDPVTGERIRNRLEAEARRLCKADKKLARAGGVERRTFGQCMDSAHPINRIEGVGGVERRTFGQCMADALDRTTAGSGRDTERGGGRGNAPHPLADIAVVAHLDGAATTPTRALSLTSASSPATATPATPGGRSGADPCWSLLDA